MKNSLAIAYAMKRKSKKMAGGGDVKGVHEESLPGSKTRRAGSTQGSTLGQSRDLGFESRMAKHYPSSLNIAKEHARNKLSELKSMPNPKLKGLADGGPVVDPTQRPYSATNSSIAQGIAGLNKHAEGGEVKDGDGLVDRIIKRMSEGGKVANDTLEDIDETPAQYDDLVLDDGLEPDFSGPGNEIGDEAEDDDQKDIVSRVMSSRRKKDRMPNPA